MPSLARLEGKSRRCLRSGGNATDRTPPRSIWGLFLHHCHKSLEQGMGSGWPSVDYSDGRTLCPFFGKFLVMNMITTMPRIDDPVLYTQYERVCNSCRLRWMTCVVLAYTIDTVVHQVGVFDVRSWYQSRDFQSRQSSTDAEGARPSCQPNYYDHVATDHWHQLYSCKHISEQLSRLTLD